MSEIYNKITDVLQSMPLTQALEPAELSVMIDNMQICQFLPGETIITQGQPVPGLYILVQGEADVTLKLPGGNTKLIAVLTGKDFFGDVVLIRGGKATATIKATTALKCLFISKQVTEALQVISPLIFYKLITAISYQVCRRITNNINNLSGRIDDVNLSKTIPAKLISEAPLSLESLQQQKLSLELLSRLNCLNTYTHHQIKTFIDYFKEILVAKNSCINSEAQLSSGYYFVIQGALGMVVTQNNCATKLAVLGAGSIVMNAYQPLGVIKPAYKIPAFYIARENTILFQLEQQQLANLYEQHPALYYAWHMSIAKQLVSLLDNINKQLIRFEVQFPEHNFIKYLDHQG